MTIATLETTDATTRLKELAIIKAEGGQIDNGELQDLLDARRIERRHWLDAVDTLEHRRKASKSLESAQREVQRAAEDDLAEFANDRETMRTECEAKRDALQVQIDELTAKQREAMAPLKEFDNRLARLDRDRHAGRRAAESLVTKSREVLESTADAGLCRQIDELCAERDKIVVNLGCIKRPRVSREQARTVIEQGQAKKQTLASLGMVGESPFAGSDMAATGGNGIPNPGTIIWQHDECDREESQLRADLGRVERKLERLNASKLDWRNVSIG